MSSSVSWPPPRPLLPSRPLPPCAQPLVYTRVAASGAAVDPLPIHLYLEEEEGEGGGGEPAQGAAGQEEEGQAGTPTAGDGAAGEAPAQQA